MGEAASRVPKDECALYPEIPWPQIVGLQSRLIHGYDAADRDMLWQTIDRDLPPLITAVETILPQEETDWQS